MKKILSKIDLSYVYSFLGEATLGLTFLFYAFMGRVLGPEQYGTFAAAIALGGILSLFIQFGLPALLGREVAANPENGARLTSLFLRIECCNGLIILPFLWPITQLLGFSNEGILICYLVFLSEICRSAKLTLRNVLRGIDEFSVETISVSLERLLTYGLAGSILLITENIIWVITTIIVVRLAEILILTYYINQKTPIFSEKNTGSIWKYVKTAYPFALSGVLWVLYYQVDILALQWLDTSAETGLYSAAYRIVEIFSALPRVVFYVSFTKFARCHRTQPERLPKEIYKTTCLLVLGVLPLIIAAGYFTEPLVTILFGSSFVGATGALSVLIPSLAIKLFGSLSRYLFEATGQERLLPPMLLTTVVVNIIANIILIPTYGAVGAAIATFISEVILAFIGLILIVRIGYRDIGQQLQKIVVLSLVAASIPAFSRIGLHPSVSITLMMASLIGIAVLIRPKTFFQLK